MLEKGDISKSLKAFVKETNNIPSDQAEKSIDAYCEKLEEIIFATIQKVSLVIPPGAIQVTGANGPSTNIQPITIQVALK